MATLDNDEPAFAADGQPREPEDTVCIVAGCGGSYVFDPTIEGDTCGGNRLVGWLVCDRCGGICITRRAKPRALPRWLLSSSSDPRALAVVDGTGTHAAHGPHYSRRTPGSKTFTGVGQEIVLVTEDGAAVWACVRQRTPSRRGTGGSRGRTGEADPSPRFIWRNMLFRNLGPALSSELIASALERTYEEWVLRYGALPAEPLRTEIDTRRVRSRHPGYCYLMAGWSKDRTVRGKLYMLAPARLTADEAMAAAALERRAA